MENRSYRDILSDPDAPFLRHLARTGTNYTDFHAETHPSQPNYLALFSGSTQGSTDDSCPHAFGGDNLGRQLLDAGDSFTAYSEDLPRAGWPGCSSGAYARKHAPWTNFTDLPGSVSVPMSRFPTDLNRLPDVAFVIPNLDHDMHDGTIAEGDAWLALHLGGYATWARTHDSLLVVTFDEDDRSEGNLIPTIAVGEGVPPRTDATPLNHYSLLAAIEDAFGVPRLGHARTARPMQFTS
jgi:acid phosphatase